VYGYVSCINIIDYDCYRGTSLYGVDVVCTVICHVLTSQTVIVIEEHHSVECMLGVRLCVMY
jgi:hypothetical protein